MAGPVAGYNGSVKIGANNIAQLKDLSLDLINNMQNATVMGDRAEDQLPSTYSIALKCKVNYDLTDTTGQKALQDAWLNATLLSITASPTGGGVANTSYSFSAYVGKLSISDSPDKIIEEDIELAPTGVLTIA